MKGRDEPLWPFRDLYIRAISQHQAAFRLISPS